MDRYSMMTSNALKKLIWKVEAHNLIAITAEACNNNAAKIQNGAPKKEQKEGEKKQPYLNLKRRCCWWVSLNNFTIFVHQKFLEVPFDKIT